MSQTEYAKCEMCDALVADYVESYHSRCGRFDAYEGMTLCDMHAPVCGCGECA